MKRRQKFYRKNEFDVMKSLGFRPTKNSGSGWIEKEDGISDHCICQLKSTDKDSISIKTSDIHVLIHNADVSHKIPVFAVQFFKTDEIFVLLRPEDIQDIQDILAGKHKKTVNYDFTVDNEDNMCYDEYARLSDGRNSKNIAARKNYIHKKEKEKEEARKIRRKS